MQLTNRDGALLQTLGLYGVFSTQQLRSLFFPDIAKTTMLRRLRALEDHGFLRRCSGLKGGEAAWFLTKKSTNTFGLGIPGYRPNRNTLHHDVLLSQIRISLSGVGLGEQWIPEFISKRNNVRLGDNLYLTEPHCIPDAILSVRSDGNFKAVALELELSLKSSSRYRKIFHGFRFKESMWKLWYLVPTKAMGIRLEEEWNKANYGVLFERFMWSLLAEVLENPYNVVVHSRPSNYQLRDLVEMRQPAHGDAQSVSTLLQSAG